MSNKVYTIGHSNHSMEKFLALLFQHEITVVADVRSHPFSRYNPHFNRASLQAELQNAGLGYVFLGQELGARSEDQYCYFDGRIDYDRLAQTKNFQVGLSRIAKGAKTHRIALMCAEKDPLICHRAILVSRHLEAQAISVEHILEDGQIESHNAALNRLRKELGFPERDLFRSREEIIEDAYEQRGKCIAYQQSLSIEEVEEGEAQE